MKYILLLFSIIFIFTACQNDQVQTPKLVKYYSFDEFNYTKEHISFFEKEYENILKIENLEVLNQYLNFYKKNTSYFINGKQKVENLKKRILKLKKSDKKPTELELFLKAKNIIKKDKNEAIKIYKELANKGNLKAQRELVEIYKITKPQVALKWLEKLVQSKDIRSMKEYASANIYMNRPVIVQDLKKALSTYEKLAQMGELSSIMRLGNIYEYGYHKEVAPQDKKKSLKYYELAASRNYKIAQKKLYEIYSCKDCNPNRYDEKKAKNLGEILGITLEKKVEIKEEVIDKKEIKTEEVKTEEIENKEIEVEEVKTVDNSIIIPKQKMKKKSKIEVIKCYDMQVASYTISENCKNRIQALLEKKEVISRIVLLSVVDKNDIDYFQKEETKKMLLEELSKNRVLEIEKYLQKSIKKSPKIKKYNYHVISKKSNKGVILKFY